MILRNKNAVITGCLQGIGRATLEFFASEGANIWACAQSFDESFENSCLKLSDQYNCWIKPLYFDLLNLQEIKIALQKINSDKLPVDVLVNIAGATKDSLFHMISLEEAKRIFEINLFSQIQITQFISKLMLKNKSGSIINVSSISALDGSYGQYVYSSSKSAILSGTFTLSKELAAKGIRVNVVAPGVIDTQMNSLVPQSIIEARIKSMSIKRLGRSDEVAKVIGFLASDLSNYITGQVIRVDVGL